MRIELVTIGDELLLGFTIDTNAAFLARALAAHGVEIVHRTTVGDDAERIASAVGAALSRADGVITTGGLGPTSDDRSKPAVAELFGRRMILHQPTLDALRERWARRGLGDLPKTNEQQAMVPEGATLIANRHGSAPGIWLEDARGKWVAMLPGVPREMRGMFDDALLPILRERFPADGRIVASRTLRTTGVAESRIADLIGAAELPPGVELAYLPSWEGVDLRLTIRGVHAAHARALLDEATQTLNPRLGAMVYGQDSDDLAALVLDEVRVRGAKIAVAESCTGGLLGARLTAIAGASDVFVGGVIAYDNRVKTTELGVGAALLADRGAVSEETATHMALGVCARLGVGVGLAVTGVAGPSGGSAEKPVGTVWVAAAVDGAVTAAVAQHTGDRDEIRRRATQAALRLGMRALARSDTNVAPRP